MDLLAIELTDTGIRAARSSGQDLLKVDGQRRSSPGIAWISGSGVVTGQAAADQACLQPLEINSRFWDHLDTQPASPRVPNSPNRAEVAYEHLRQVIENVARPGDDLVMAVPPCYDEEQLGLLVGIAQELSVPLRGIVASPVARDGGAGLAGTVLMVDLLLHRCVLSLVEIGDEVELGPTRICTDIGLHLMQQQWIKAVSGEFVRHTRFDPLHNAMTEQQLLSSLTQTLDLLAESDSCSVELKAGSLSHRVTVTEQLLAHAGHAQIFRLASEIQAVGATRPFASIVLTDDAARVPGLHRTITQQQAVPVHTLGPGAAAIGLARLWPDEFDQTDEDAVGYHTRRACGGGVASCDLATYVQPTHALVGGEAHALADEPLFIECDMQAGRLRLGGKAGAACLRVTGREVILEIEAGREIRVNGTTTEGALAVGLGAEISFPGCAQTMTLIVLTS